MLRRLDKSWIMLASLEHGEVGLCVNLFARPDGSFGFEEFRRDPEDAGAWTPVAFFAGGRYASRDAALVAAKGAVKWLR